MSEPTPAVLHVQPVCEPWDVTVDAVCGSLETYAEATAAAARFEHTLDAISDTDDDEAAPDATEAASDPSERNRHV